MPVHALSYKMRASSSKTCARAILNIYIRVSPTLSPLSNMRLFFASFYVKKVIPKKLFAGDCFILPDTDTFW